jgi:hypothetical protein
MGARGAIADANGAPTKHRAGAMISTQPVANAGWASLTNLASNPHRRRRLNYVGPVKR